MLSYNGILLKCYVKANDHYNYGIAALKININKDKYQGKIKMCENKIDYFFQWISSFEEFPQHLELSVPLNFLVDLFLP